MRAVQDAGEGVNVVRILRISAKSVYLGNALVGSNIDIAILGYALAILRTYYYMVRVVGERLNIIGCPVSTLQKALRARIWTQDNLANL